LCFRAPCGDTCFVYLNRATQAVLESWIQLPSSLTRAAATCVARVLPVRSLSQFC
jgi:hypothetical protein